MSSDRTCLSWLLTTGIIQVSTVLGGLGVSSVVGAGSTAPTAVACRIGAGGSRAVAAATSGCVFPGHLTD